MAYDEHRRDAAPLPVRCAVITLSDTRNQSTDTSGRTICDLLTREGHHVVRYHIIRDEPAELGALLQELLALETIDAVLTNGGTGVSRRDQTIPVIREHLNPELPGFGELFRMLSWEQIGSGAMLSRAIGGIAQGKLLFAMPGSNKAVELAMTKLILPELRHLISQVRK
jgi:molybdenum cofactor biosynthesis protein B